MNKQRIIFNCPVAINKRLKEQACNLTDREINAIFTKSDLLESCIKDLINLGISKKPIYTKEAKKSEIQISEPTYLKLKALSKESGFTMTELIIKAYERFNPDTDPAYDHLR